MVYFVDYQGVRFVMLNGNEKLEEQAKWLEGILARNPQFWTIVAIHQPFYSTAKGRNNLRLRELFIPIFDKYSVDLVLQGHDHTYGRTYKLKNGARVGDNEKGTVYVVSVSGPKVYSTNENFKDLMVKIGSGRQLFQVIGINNNRLKYESFTATGQLYDSFELQK
jgi:3',5'-cyclic AMP phosphodiesterase CpdA